MYRTRLSKWQTQLDALYGDSDTVGTLRWLEVQLTNITKNIPLELTRLEQDRQEKAKEIHHQLKYLVSKYQELTQSVQRHIQGEELTREKYKVEFEIELIEYGMADHLFNIINQSTGTFSGIQEGRERVQEIVSNYNFSSADESFSFAIDILGKLNKNHKNVPPTDVALDKLLKKGHKVKDIYNFLFGFEYLSPQFSLSLNGKSLKRLSPGERGILLLIFYLVVDCGDEPLIIDQPEGNLNNQSIFDNLVPVFKKAKEKRQIIVVTHNPNLAVVCDAEQIIHAKIDFQDGNRIHFESGALENPIFNKLSLDVLEGTTPAFDARRLTYETIR